MKYRSITDKQKSVYWVAFKAACFNLGLIGREEKDAYRHRAMRETCGKESINDLSTTHDFEAVVHRFFVDAGDFEQAAKFAVSDEHRMAYLIKVECCQIMQLKGGSESDARNYIEGIIKQARINYGVSPSDNSFWMDVSPRSLQNLLQILDTYRRKLLKANFPAYPLKFDDTVRYSVDGTIRERTTGIPRTYYADIPFKVNVRG